MLDNAFKAIRKYEDAVYTRLAETKPMAVLYDVEDEECNDPFVINFENGDDIDTCSIDMVKAENEMIICHICERNGEQWDEWYPYHYFGLEGIYILSNIAWE